jgi:hypothetical protein
LLLPFSIALAHGDIDGNALIMCFAYNASNQAMAELYKGELIQLCELIHVRVRDEWLKQDIIIAIREHLAERRRRDDVLLREYRAQQNMMEETATLWRIL